ncbi:MAG: LCP family protein [Lachnospiraceae bacterium]
MSHDFDDELDRSKERRSRRNPRMKEETGKDLKVFDDSGVYPIANSAKKASAETAASQLMPSHLEEKLVKRKRRRRIIAMIVAECLALTCIFGYAYAARRLNMIQRPEFNIDNIKNTDLDVETVEKMKGYWTIAIFGVDARDRAIAKGTNADVNMICNINQDTGEIKLVSVFRDTYLNISDNGSYNKINQAYFLGGPQQAVAALNRNLDLNITDYMTFNWKAVADAINILGGVDIELSKAEFYYINSFITETVKVTGIGSQHLTQYGMNHLDGVQAVAYGRLRLMDTDYARTERQRKVIAQAFEKAKKADFNTLNTIIGTVFPNIATNIGVDDLVMNARSISKYHLGDTTGFPQARGDANMGKKGACVIPRTLESNVIQLHEFLFGGESYTPSATVKSISSKISADSGMYTEGKYVDKVTTDGGVIQQPKTTAEATKSSTKSTSDDERETDESGNPIETTTGSVKPGSRPTTAETDENGNSIETEETSSARPGQTDESSTAASRPGGTSESSTGAVRPGETTTSAVPGGTTASAQPGGSESTTSSTTSAAPGGSSTESTTASVPGFPGSTSSSETVGSNGPGGQTSDSSGVTTIIGTVAAPGQ